MYALLFKSVGGFFLRNIKYLIVIAVLGTVAWQVNSLIDKAAQEKKELRERLEITTRDRDTAVRNAAEIKAVAEENRLAAHRLLEEKLKADDAARDLAGQVKALQTFSKKLVETIAASKPEEDGPIAPVLKSAIDAIQKHNSGVN